MISKGKGPEANARPGPLKSLPRRYASAETKRGVPVGHEIAKFKGFDGMPTFVDAISADRFSTYRLWAGQDDALARRLYTFNVQLSEALYGPLRWRCAMSPTAS